MKNYQTIIEHMAIQITAKVGGEPWRIETSSEYKSKHNCAFAGLHSSKEKDSYTVSFAGGVNLVPYQAYSQYVKNVHRREDMDETILRRWIKDWLGCYRKNTKSLP